MQTGIDSYLLSAKRRRVVFINSLSEDQLWTAASNSQKRSIMVDEKGAQSALSGLQSLSAGMLDGDPQLESNVKIYEAGIHLKLGGVQASKRKIGAEIQEERDRLVLELGSV